MNSNHADDQKSDPENHPDDEVIIMAELVDPDDDIVVIESPFQAQPFFQALPPSVYNQPVQDERRIFGVVVALVIGLLTLCALAGIAIWFAAPSFNSSPAPIATNTDEGQAVPVDQLASPVEDVAISETPIDSAPQTTPSVAPGSIEPTPSLPKIEPDNRPAPVEETMDADDFPKRIRIERVRRNLPARSPTLAQPRYFQVALDHATQIVSSGNGNRASITNFDCGAPMDHAWSPDGRSIALLFRDRLWHVELENLTVVKSLRGENFEQVCWTAAGIVVINREDGQGVRFKSSTLTVLDDLTWQPRMEFPMDSSLVPRVIGSQDSAQIVLLRNAREFQVVDLDEECEIYRVDLADYSDQVSPATHDLLMQIRSLAVIPEKALFLIAPSRTGGGHLFQLQFEDEGLFFETQPRTLENAMNRQSWTADSFSKLGANHAIRQGLDLPSLANDSLPRISAEIQGKSICFWSGEDVEPTYSVPISKDLEKCRLAPNPLAPHVWLAVGSKSMSFIDLKAQRVATDSTDVPDDDRMFYVPSPLPKLAERPKAEGDKEQLVNDEVDESGVFRFAKMDGEWTVDAALSGNAENLFVRRGKLLYNIAVPEFKVIAKNFVPDDSTLVVTKSSVAVVNSDELHIYDNESLAYQGTYKLPAPIRFATSTASSSICAFIWCDDVPGEKSHVPEERLGLIDLDTRKLLLDIHREDFSINWRSRNWEPRATIDLRLLPSGCLMWTAHSKLADHPCLHHLILGEEFYEHRHRLLLANLEPKEFVLGPNENQMSFRCNQLGKRVQYRWQCLTVTANESGAVFTKLNRVDTLLGTGRTQQTFYFGYNSSGAASIGRFRAGEISIHHVPGRGAGPPIRLERIVRLNRSSVLAVGRDGVCLIPTKY